MLKHNVQQKFKQKVINVWFNNKKTKDVPLPPLPGFPMPEPIKIPEISREIKSEKGNNSKSEEMINECLYNQRSTFSNQPNFQDSISNSENESLNIASQDDKKNLQKSIHLIKNNNHTLQDFYFVEKTNFSQIRELFAEIEGFLLNSKNYIEESRTQNENKNALILQFKITMEDIQKRTMFIDKTLFGE